MCFHFLYIGDAGDVRPMLFQNVLTKGVDFALPYRFQSCTLESEVKTTNSSEKTGEANRRIGRRLL